MIKFFFEGDSIAKDLIVQNLKFEEVSFEECEVVVSSKLSTGEFNSSVIQKVLNEYSKLNKLVLIFLISDNSGKFKIPNNVVFYRTSLEKNKVHDRDNLLPYIWECFKNENYFLAKTEKPKVGFCGNIKKNLGKRLSTIQAFKKDDFFESNFILRNDFWGGNPHDKNLELEFKNNINSNHFTICNRGRGNFAIRFYQTLSLGRIPVLIDTDMVFPFENEINWKELIITGKSEIELINNLKFFWELKSDEEIIHQQKKCLNTFENYFLPDKFSKKVEEKLKMELQNISFSNDNGNFLINWIKKLF